MSAKPKLSRARARELRLQLEAIERELAGEPELEIPGPSLHGLREQLRAHRAAVRASGPLLSLEDERREGLLLRAIELAKAPKNAQTGRADSTERGDGVSNASLMADDAEE